MTVFAGRWIAEAIELEESGTKEFRLRFSSAFNQLTVSAMLVLVS